MKKIYLILLLGLFLRLIYIDQSFWLDESIQALTAQESLNEIILQNSADFHPPFSYLISHFWIQFGTSEIWLRLLPVLFGLGTVWIIYLLAKILFNEKVGLLAGLFLAIAPYHIYYSQEFRMYSMVTFFVCVSMYFFLQLVLRGKDERGRNWQIIGFVLSSVLILYTHYLAGVIFVTQLGYLLFSARNRLREFVGYYVLIGIGFLPWLPMLYQQLSFGVNTDSFLPGWSKMLSLSFYTSIPLLFVKFILGRIDFVNNFIYAIVVLISFIVFGLTQLYLVKKIVASRKLEEKIVVLLLWLFIPILVTFLISFKLPMFQPFRLLFILPVFLVLIAVGIVNSGKYQKWLFCGVVLVFAISNIIFWSNQSYWREDWRGSVAYLEQNQTEKSVVITAWPEPFAPMIWYGRKLSIRGVLPKLPAKQDLVEDQLTAVSNFETIFYIDYLSQLSDPDKLIEQELEKLGYKLVETKDFRGVGFIYRFEKQPSLASNIPVL